MADTPQSRHRKLTQAELMAEATALFGDDVMTWAFQCPRCGDVATLGDHQQAAGDTELAGQECIGRSLGPMDRPRDPKTRNFLDRGCDWTAYGLFRGPWEIVMPAAGDRPARPAWSFPLATPAAATPATEASA